MPTEPVAKLSAHHHPTRRSTPGEIDTSWGTKLTPDDIVDLDMCWAYDLADPWGNVYELNCYEYERVQVELIDADDITPRRFWPAELYKAWPN